MYVFPFVESNHRSPADGDVGAVSETKTELALSPGTHVEVPASYTRASPSATPVVLTSVSWSSSRLTLPPPTK